LLKAGERWREKLTVEASGTLGCPLTISSYGAGAAPIIDGTDIITTWTIEGAGPAYKKQATFGTETQCCCFENGARLVKKTSVATVAATAGTFWLDVSTTPDTLYVHCTGDADPATKTIEYTNRAQGVLFNGQDYIRVEGIEATKTAQSPFDLRSAVTGAVIEDCVASWGGLRGFDLGTLVNLKEDCTLHGCTAHDMFGEGIWTGGATNILIEDCTAYNICLADALAGTGIAAAGYGTGIRVGVDSYNTTVRGCYVHDVGYGYGIDSEWEASGAAPVGTIIEKNLVEMNLDNGSYGIQLDGINDICRNNVVVMTVAHQAIYMQVATADGTQILHNTLIGKTGASWLMELTKGSNITVKNNLFYREANGPVLNVAADAQAGIVIDYNEYYSPNNEAWKWGATTYQTSTGFADYKAASGQDANAVNANPVFVSASDFHLQAGSPCIGTGDATVGVPDDYDDVMRGIAVDIGAYEKV